jgi:hypothetical protein
MTAEVQFSALVVTVAGFPEGGGVAGVVGVAGGRGPEESATADPARVNAPRADNRSTPEVASGCAVDLVFIRLSLF